jgi:hypothetical protein
MFIMFNIYRHAKITVNLFCVYAVCWTAVAHTHVFGGVENTAATLDGCKKGCASTSGCIGIDWDSLRSIKSQCFLAFPNITAWGPANGVTHFKINRQC